MPILRPNTKIQEDIDRAHEKCARLYEIVRLEEAIRVLLNKENEQHGQDNDKQANDMRTSITEEPTNSLNITIGDL